MTHDSIPRCEPESACPMLRTLLLVVIATLAACRDGQGDQLDATLVATPTAERAHSPAKRAPAPTDAAPRDASSLSDARPEAAPAVYEFKLNGRRYRPTIYPTGAASPGPGDVAQIVLRVRSYLISLDEPGLYDLQPTIDGMKLYRLAEDGTKRVVGARIAKGTLADSEIAGLRGLQIEVWSRNVEVLLSKIDAARTCVVLSSAAARQPGRSVPTLPSGLRCLRLGRASDVGFSDFSSLASLPDLAFLDVRHVPGRSPGAAALPVAAPLRHLGLSTSAPVPQAETFKAWSRLRSLDLSGSKALTDVSFVEGLDELRSLSVAGTGVVDLSPIANAAAIETVVADDTPLAKLPSVQVASLRVLTAFGSKLPAEEASRFAAANPGCRVYRTDGDRLRRATADANRVVFHGGMLCPFDDYPSRGRPFFDLKDRAEVQRLLTAIDFIEEPEGYADLMGCGGAIMELYRDEIPLEAVSIVYFEGVSNDVFLGSHSMWWGDAPLKPEARQVFVDWLRTHGVRLEGLTVPSPP